jgi:glutathione S-transferase
METLQLYHCNTSYASQKVRLFMAQMGIPYESRHIDIRAQEHITSNYREINPNGLVPTLVAAGKVICGSTSIMVYLHDKYCKDGQKMSPKLRKAIISFCFAHEALHDPHMRTLSYCLIFMANKKYSAETERLLEVADNHPNKERGEFLKAAIRGELTSQNIKIAEHQIKQALQEMDTLLSGNPDSGFMFGNKYSMADAVATAGLFRVEKLQMQDEIKDNKLLAIYYERMRQLPSFNAAGMV